MTTMGKAVGRGRQDKKQEPLLECSPAPLKKKRGRKRRSPSPPPPPGPRSFFKVMIQEFKSLLYIPPLLTLDWKGLDKKYVYIEDADGMYWSVKISMVNGSLAFQNGWSHFCSAHSIAVGELLIFTYTGGLLFTARIFEKSGLERVGFQIKTKSGKCTKEMCTTELKSDNVPSKRKKASYVSEGKQNPTINELLRLKLGNEGAQIDFSDIEIVESDSNSKEPEKVNTVEELNKMPLTKPEKSDEENLETVANKSIKNKMITTEKGGSLFHCDRAMVSKLAKKPDTMTTTDTCSFLVHSDIKEGLPEMNSSNKMEINDKMEESNPHDIEMIDSEPHIDNMAAQSNLQNAERNQLKFNMVEPNEIDDVLLLTTDGICYTFDEKFAAPAIGTDFDVNGQVKPICQNEHAACGPEISVPCETISVVSSNPILISTNKTKKENLIQTSEEYEDSQIKGIGHNVFIDEDIKDVTPSSSCRSGTVTARRDLVGIPSSSCFSFSVCLSDDAQSSLETPQKLASQMGKLKNERKVVVLQDPSMRCWPVLYHDSTNFTGFIGGWLDFARANDIARGDICEFALVNKLELKFQVQSSKKVGSIPDEKS